MREIEENLTRELREVADGLPVPPLPALPDDQQRRWLPALAAAAVVLIVLGVVAVVAGSRDDSAPEPAPSPTPSPTSSPTPSETTATEPPVEVSTAAPSIPYVLGRKLYVDGEEVPGDWWSVRSGGDVWLALRSDYTWWWGRDAQMEQIAVANEVAPAMSPSGTYIAFMTDGGSSITGFATDGAGLGSAPVAESPPEFSSVTGPRAVTDDGDVVVTGGGVSMLWRPLEGGGTFDLTETAPGEFVVDSTTAGLVVTTEDESEQYLAEVSEEGGLTRVGDLPPSQALVVSPGAARMAWAPFGSLGGEVTGIGELEAGTVDGSERTTFLPPAGWIFQVQSWTWEDDDNLVSVVNKNGNDRMVRCSALTQGCVLIEAP